MCPILKHKTAYVSGEIDLFGPQTSCGSRLCVTPDPRCCRGGSSRIHQVRRVGQQARDLPIGSHVRTTGTAAEEGISSADRANRRPAWREKNQMYEVQPNGSWDATDGGIKAQHCSDCTPSKKYYGVSLRRISFQNLWGESRCWNPGRSNLIFRSIIPEQKFWECQPHPAIRFTRLAVFAGRKDLWENPGDWWHFLVGLHNQPTHD